MSSKDRDFHRHAGGSGRAPTDEDEGETTGEEDDPLALALGRIGIALTSADDEVDDDSTEGNDLATKTAASGADYGALPSSEAWQLVAVQGLAHDPYEGRAEARRSALAQIATARQTAFGLSRLTIDYVRLSGAEKLDVLFALADPQSAIQALSGEEFVFLVKDIGLNDSADLMAFASPRQLQACIDLDAWVGDVLDLEAVAQWVAVCSEAGTDTLDRFIRSQEDGVLCHYLISQLMVIEDLENADEQLPDDWDFFHSPDQTMIIAMPPGLADPLALRAVIDSLYRHSTVRARGILRATRFELPENLGEDAFDERNRRIEIWGFLPRHEALHMYTFREPYAWRDEVRATFTGAQPLEGDGPGPYLPDEEPDRLGLVLRGEDAGGFLGEALLRCPAQHQQRLQLAFVRLAYQALAAREERPAEIDALANWSRHALRTCEMGLVHLSSGDLRLAAMLLQHMFVVDLFRAGHSLVLLLHHAARDLRRRLGGQQRLALLDPPDDSLLEGLLRPLPMLAAGVLGSVVGATGHASELVGDGAAISSFRPFERFADIEAARARLHGLRATVLLLDRLAAGDLPAAIARLEAAVDPSVVGDLRLSTLLGTALAWQILDGSPLLVALPIADLRRFLRLAFEGPVGHREVRILLRERLAQVPDAVPGLSEHEVAGLQRLIERVLVRLAEELGGLDPREAIEAAWIGTALAVTMAAPPDPRST